MLFQIRSWSGMVQSLVYFFFLKYFVFYAIILSFQVQLMSGLENLSKCMNLITARSLEIIPTLNYRLAPAGIVKPLVMKSVCFCAILLPEENNVFRFSLGAIFLRLFRSSCSARTLAVNDAVSWFLIAFVADVFSIGSAIVGMSGPATASIVVYGLASPSSFDT